MLADQSHTPSASQKPSNITQCSTNSKFIWLMLLLHLQLQAPSKELLANLFDFFFFPVDILVLISFSLEPSGELWCSVQPSISLLCLRYLHSTQLLEESSSSSLSTRQPCTNPRVSKSHQVMPVLQVTNVFSKKRILREQGPQSKKCMFRKIRSISQRTQTRGPYTNGSSMIYLFLVSN